MTDSPARAKFRSWLTYDAVWLLLHLAVVALRLMQLLNRWKLISARQSALFFTAAKYLERHADWLSSRMRR
ncbi:hypothetical protein EB232_25440 [Mesorhizobium sp. NZP2077]|nr:hypothetical protein EB232_25440 [Mesorhizobium sp. NZP2077]